MNNKIKLPWAKYAVQFRGLVNLQPKQSRDREASILLLAFFSFSNTPETVHKLHTSTGSLLLIAYTSLIFYYYQYFLGCTKSDTQRQQNPGAGCCATDLTPATPANSWFDCFLMCEKRQREHHDCEYFEFMDLNYAGMAEQRVDKTK